MRIPEAIISGEAIPLGLPNIDTDTILPAAYLRSLSREGLGSAAFRGMRFSADGTELADSLFNLPRYRGAPILIAGENFGCGSSREHAVWAISDMGVRALIAPSFGDIFAGNAFRNQIVPIHLPEQIVRQLLALSEAGPMQIDIAAQHIDTADGTRFHFELDPFRKRLFLEGIDEIALTERFEEKIKTHQARTSSTRPWLASISKREGAVR